MMNPANDGWVSVEAMTNYLIIDLGYAFNNKVTTYFQQQTKLKQKCFQKHQFCGVKYMFCKTGTKM